MLSARFTNINNVVLKYKNAVLIAVSKKKPASDIKVIYELGHRDFGENYIQELEEKAASLPKDIRWHFIGHLQSNKCKVISDLVKNGHNITLHTLDSLKLAKKLNNSLSNMKINILIQVNTSGEESKSGVEKDECKALIKDIREECTNLNIIGLMCIGAPNQPTPNPDFIMMEKLKTDLDQEFQSNFKLSMGMSSDFELALMSNSNFVRVGSSIFGERQ